MNFIEEFIPSQHYGLMQKWFEQRKYPCAPLKLLPPIGLVVGFNDQPMVMGFLIRTDANTAIVAHLISDPDADKALRGESVDIVIQTLCEYAKSLGFLVVNAATNLQYLLKRYERLGWLKADENLTGVWRQLCL